MLMKLDMSRQTVKTLPTSLANLWIITAVNQMSKRCAYPLNISSWIHTACPANNRRAYRRHCHFSNSIIIYMKYMTSQTVTQLPCDSGCSFHCSHGFIWKCFTFRQTNEGCVCVIEMQCYFNSKGLRKFPKPLFTLMLEIQHIYGH